MKEQQDMFRRLTPESISILSKITEIALLGGSGFIGSSLLRLLFQVEGTEFPHLLLATRNLTDNKLVPLTASSNREKTTQFIECDHLNYTQMKKLTQKSHAIIALAGLAWQHPGGKHLSQQDLLKHEILQNAVSGLLLSTVVDKDQLVVWSSTSAIGGMFARLSPENQIVLKKEATQLADMLITKIRPEDDQQISRSIIDKVIETYPFAIFPKAPGSSEQISYALEFSYAYSKYIGELILERLSIGNIRALQISDVYGPGQDISPRILNPQLPARRIQRYVAAYRQIAQGNTDWIPSDGQSLYGFSKDSQGKIIQTIWSDDVFPTHVTDICEMLLRSLGQTLSPTKTVLAINGNRLTNKQLMETLNDYFNCQVTIITDKPLSYQMPQNSHDLPLLKMSSETLIAFDEGLRDWIEKE